MIPFHLFSTGISEPCHRNYTFRFGTDGAQGIKAIKESGGLTLAQDKKSTPFADIPQSAVATGCIDAILSPWNTSKHREQYLINKYVDKAFFWSSESGKHLFLIIFEEKSGFPYTDEGKQSITVIELARQRANTLEQELHFTKESLRNTINFLEISNNKLQRANETIHATNEELRSTNEELETRKEELCITNDELQKK